MATKVIRYNDDRTQVLVAPSYGLAMKLAAKSGMYKFTRFMAIPLLVAAVVVLILAKKDIIANPEGGNWISGVMFVLSVAAFIFWFAKPSNVMVNNEKWITVKEYNQRERAGTLDELFTRTWE